MRSMRAKREWVWAVVVASAALTGCVGYDGASDGASYQAQSLGLTQEEESRIREALSQKALTADEIAAMEKEIERTALPEEWKTQATVGDSAAKVRSQPDWKSCTTDLNCSSLHCGQANACLPAALFSAQGTPATYAFECASNRIESFVTSECTRWTRPWYCPWCKSTCAESASRTVTRCAPSLATDSNGVRDAGETDTDCGGSSIYRCATGMACRATSDCGVGTCDPTTSRCSATGNGLVE